MLRTPRGAVNGFGAADRHSHRVATDKSLSPAAEARYNYVLEPLNASVTEKTVKLRARLTGDFPGSPVKLDHTFTLADAKITSLKMR